MHRHLLMACAVVFLAGLLGGCAGNGPTNVGSPDGEVSTAAAPSFVLWPLSLGNTWRYRVTTYSGPAAASSDGAGEIAPASASTSTHALKATGKQTIGGASWFVLTETTVGTPGSQQHYSRHVDAGLCWKNTLVTGAYFLVHTPIAVGTSWNNPGPGGGTVTWSIVSLTATVTVPAGTFTNCVLVTDTNSATPGITTRRWYASGVGLVRVTVTDGGVLQSKQELLDSVVGAKAVAISLLLTRVIKPSTLTHDVLAFTLPSALPAGAQIAPYAPHPLPASVTTLPDLSDVTTLAKSQWFFWVDDDPYALSAHPTRYVLIDPAAAEVTVSEKWWPPAVNGRFIWSADADRWNPANWAFSLLGTAPAPASARLERAVPVGGARPGLSARGDVDGVVLVNGWSAGQTCNGPLSEDMADGRDWARLHGVPDSTAGSNPGGIAGMRAAIQGQVNNGANDIILYMCGHGGVNAAGESYLSIHGHVVTAKDICDLLDEFPNVDFKVIVDACRSGGLVAELAACAEVRIVLTSAASGESAYIDHDPKDASGHDLDPNPEDDGTEYSSGFWHDMFRVLDDPTQLAAAHQWAADQGLPPMAGVVYYASCSATSLDVDALRGLTHPQVKIHAAAPGG